MTSHTGRRWKYTLHKKLNHDKTINETEITGGSGAGSRGSGTWKSEYKSRHIWMTLIFVTDDGKHDLLYMKRFNGF